MEDHEQFKLTFCFLGGKKICFGDLVHLLRRKLSLLIYWDCLSNTEMTHAHPEGFRWHHKFTAGHHGPVQNKLRSKKSFPLTPVPKLHYSECTLLPQKLMEDGVSKNHQKVTPYWFACRKTTAWSDMHHVCSDFFIFAYHDFFKKISRKRWDPRLKYVLGPAFLPAHKAVTHFTAEKRGNG